MVGGTGPGSRDRDPPHWAGSTWGTVLWYLMSEGSNSVSSSEDVPMAKAIFIGVSSPCLSCPDGATTGEQSSPVSRYGPRMGSYFLTLGVSVPAAVWPGEGV